MRQREVSAVCGRNRWAEGSLTLPSLSPGQGNLVNKNVITITSNSTNELQTQTFLHI